MNWCSNAFASRSQVLARFDGPAERDRRMGRAARRAAGGFDGGVHDRTSDGDCGPAGGCGQGRAGAGGRVAAAAEPGVGLPAPDGKGVTRLIFNIVRTALIALRRDRASLALSFILPIAFFSIFAVIFGGQHDSTPKINVIVVDEDQSRASHDLVQGLERESSLVISTRPASKSKTAAPLPEYTAATAEAAVKAGDAPVALIIPQGFGQHPISFGPDSSGHGDSTAERRERHDCAADGGGPAAKGGDDCDARGDGGAGNEVHRQIHWRAHAGAAQA